MTGRPSAAEHWLRRRLRRLLGERTDAEVRAVTAVEFRGRIASVRLLRVVGQKRFTSSPRHKGTRLAPPVAGFRVHLVTIPQLGRPVEERQYAYPGIFLPHEIANVPRHPPILCVRRTPSESAQSSASARGCTAMPRQHAVVF